MAKITLTPEELSDLIGLTYDSAFEQVQWRSLLRQISSMFPGVVGVAYGYEGDTVLPDYSSTNPSGVFTERVELGFKTLTNMTAAEAMQKIPNGFVTRTKLFIGKEEWQQSSVYQKGPETGRLSSHATDEDRPQR